jgi:hypothetical protein
MADGAVPKTAAAQAFSGSGLLFSFARARLWAQAVDFADFQGEGLARVNNKSAR